MNSIHTESEALLREALRRKGIGPKGSKKLPPDMLREVLPLLAQPETNRTTAAAFWTACLLLDNSEEEEALLAPVRNAPEFHLLPELQALMFPEKEAAHTGFLRLVHKLIQRHDLSTTEAESAMTFFWEPSVPEWIKGAFLQGARIKRETPTEDAVFLDSLWNKATHISVDMPYLIDLCDSYDGTNRSYHLTPFVAAVLAAMGIPTILHGVESVGPKYGITSSQLLHHAGKANTLPLAQATTNLLNPKIGWCYLDQSQVFPELFALRQLRHDMVKRPFLATFDKLLQPIHNRTGNIVITGYVHAHYREEVVRVLSWHHQNRMVFNLRTIEGSTNCWGKKSTPFVGYRNTATTPPLGMDRSERPAWETPLSDFLQQDGKALVEGELVPEHFGISGEDHQIDKGIQADHIAHAALSALQGETGLVQELLIYHAAAFAWLADIFPHESEAGRIARNVVESGKAWEHWNNQS